MTNKTVIRNVIIAAVLYGCLELVLYRNFSGILISIVFILLLTLACHFFFYRTQSERSKKALLLLNFSTLFMISLNEKFMCNIHFCDSCLIGAAKMGIPFDFFFLCCLWILFLKRDYFWPKLLKRKGILALMVVGMIGASIVINIIYPVEGRLDRDMPLIMAAQLTQYPASIKKSVDEMIKAGISPKDLKLSLRGTIEHDQNSKFSVLGKRNDKVSNPPERAFEGYFDIRVYGFTILKNKSNIHAIFTDSNKIPSMGTEATEILYIAWPIKNDVCSQINRGLGIERAGYFASSHILTTPPNLAEKSDSPVTLESSGGALPLYACVQDANGVRYYYHTIVER